MPKMENYVSCLIETQKLSLPVISLMKKFGNSSFHEFLFSYGKITIPKLIHIILFNFFLVPFQIIKFPNDPCDVSSTKNGTCYTS